MVMAMRRWSKKNIKDLQSEENNMKKDMLKTSYMVHCITLLHFIVVTTLSNFDVLSIYFFIPLSTLGKSF